VAFSTEKSAAKQNANPRASLLSEGHIFLSPRKIATQAISHHLSQATVALLMSTNRLLTHDVLLVRHHEQTASSIVEEHNE
jgi:hypothetical protein